MSELMTEINNPRLIRNCKAARIMLLIFRILTYVGIGLIAVLLSFIIFSDNISDMVVSDMTIDGILPGATLTPTRGNIIALFVCALSALVLISFIILFAERIMRTVGPDRSPFVPENVRRLKLIAIFWAASTMIPSWLSQIALFITNGNAVELSIELSVLLIAFVIWCFALIFEHGVELQQRDDETL